MGTTAGAVSSPGPSRKKWSPGRLRNRCRNTAQRRAGNPRRPQRQTCAKGAGKCGKISDHLGAEVGAWMRALVDVLGPIDVGKVLPVVATPHAGLDFVCEAQRRYLSNGAAEAVRMLLDVRGIGDRLFTGNLSRCDPRRNQIAPTRLIQLRLFVGRQDTALLSLQKEIEFRHQSPNALNSCSSVMLVTPSAGCPSCWYPAR